MLVLSVFTTRFNIINPYLLFHPPPPPTHTHALTHPWTCSIIFRQLLYLLLRPLLRLRPPGVRLPDPRYVHVNPLFDPRKQIGGEGGRDLDQLVTIAERRPPFQNALDLILILPLQGDTKDQVSNGGVLDTSHQAGDINAKGIDDVGKEDVKDDIEEQLHQMELGIEAQPAEEIAASDQVAENVKVKEADDPGDGDGVTDMAKATGESDNREAKVEVKEPPEPVEDGAEQEQYCEPNTPTVKISASDGTAYVQCIAPDSHIQVRQNYSDPCHGAGKD